MRGGYMAGSLWRSALCMVVSACMLPSQAYVHVAGIVHVHAGGMHREEYLAIAALQSVGRPNRSHA